MTRVPPLLLLALLTCTSLARADEPAAGTTEARASIGVGVGFASDGYGVGGLNGVGGSGTAIYTRAWAPFGTALAEWRVSPALRLGLGVQGSYTTIHHRNDREDVTSYFPRRSAAVSGTVFARWVLNPGGVVEFSPLLAVGGGGSWTDGATSYSVQDADGKYRTLLADATGRGVEGRLGFVLERALLPQLMLRFETSFVRVDYDRTRVVTHAPDGDEIERLSLLTMSAYLAPSLQLRMSF